MLFFSPRQVDSRDYVFPRASSSSSEALQEGRSEELMDKEVRAVFLCLFTYLLGDYQNYVTVIRFKPPSFYFNKVSDVLEEWKSGTVLVSAPEIFLLDRNFCSTTATLAVQKY